MSESMYELAYVCPQGLKSHMDIIYVHHAYISLNIKPTKGAAFQGNTLFKLHNWGLVVYTVRRTLVSQRPSWHLPRSVAQQFH